MTNYAGIEVRNYKKAVSKPGAHGWLLDETIVSTDAGNGKISAWYMKDGKPFSVNFPHGMVRSTGGSMAAIEGIAQAPMTYITWKDERYAIGQGAWELGAYAPETFRNSDMRYGSDHHICMIMASLALLGISAKQPLTIIVPAPPGLLNEEMKTKISGSIRAGEFGANDGKWTIALNTEKPITYTIKKVVVIPEGIGGYAAYRWDANGEIADARIADHERDALVGHLQIVDLGFGTADSYTIFNGAIAAESITHATDAQGGLYFKIVQPIMDRISAIPGAKSKTDAHVEGWLREWIQREYPGDFKVRIGTSDVNIGSFIYGLMQQYGDWVIQSIIEPARSRGANAVLECGGGWQLAESVVRSAYPKFDIINPRMFKHTAQIPLWDLNGYGQLIFAANNIRFAREGK